MGVKCTSGLMFIVYKDCLINKLGSACLMDMHRDGVCAFFNALFNCVVTRCIL